MKRMIVTDFWLDSKVEDMSSTAKYVLLYLLTNPKTSLTGCYEVTYKRSSNDMGLTAKQVENAMAELCTANVISYCAATNEVLIHNWDKYNWTSSPKLDKPLVENIESVKNPQFRQYLIEKFERARGRDYPHKDRVSENDDRVLIPYEYPSISISIPSTVPIPEEDGGLGEGERDKTVAETTETVVAYLNEKLGAHYKPKSKETVKRVSARLSDGFTVDDFKTVIDKKVAAWRSDPRMARYLRPETLFGPKFEGYLNEVTAERGSGNARFDKYR